ncbi:hypothetical protein FM117_03695 [Micrococcus luteus Mu201]|nr:hypothetical protein FM117_03695 [Micrococcus luteus Mu201]
MDADLGHGSPVLAPRAGTEPLGLSVSARPGTVDVAPGRRARHQGTRTTACLIAGGEVHRWALMLQCSSGTHQISDPPSSVGLSAGASAVRTSASASTADRKARPDARRRRARWRHSSPGCNHAPRPGRRRSGSQTTDGGSVEESRATRTSSC